MQGLTCSPVLTHLQLAIVGGAFVLHGLAGTRSTAGFAHPAGFGGATLLEEDLGLAHLGRQEVLARADQSVLDQRAFRIAALLTAAGITPSLNGRSRVAQPSSTRVQR